MPGSPHCSQGFVRPINLVQTEVQRELVRFSLYFQNARSVKNKADRLCDFICSNDIDILALTEMWLCQGYREATVLASLVPPGYSIQHQAHESGYGGVAVVHKDNVTIAPLDIATYTTFECLDLTVKTNLPTSLSVKYRPPTSSKNGLIFTKFHCFPGDKDPPVWPPADWWLL